MNFEQETIWIQYAKSAWDAAGRPLGLNPHTISSNPIEYDEYYYDYFERRYIDMWLAIYSRINPITGYLLKREDVSFREWWERNFNWETIWKQVLPLLVYGTNLGAGNKILIELASIYALGQAIPSVVIDCILDESPETSFNNSDAAFCILAYTKALQHLKKMHLPNGDIIENTFVELTSEMYSKMLVEYSCRFNALPPYVSDAMRNYLLPNSRLSSSVFFGILPIWAHALVNKTPSEEMMASMLALRTVRQLNDEILDVYDDIHHGLLTLPWLYALEEHHELREAINNLWKSKNNAEDFLTCQQILERSSGRERAASKSLEILFQSMKITMELFPVNQAFEISLLHNIRWGLLNWLKKVDYTRDLATIHQPCKPQDKIVSLANPIEPVPGGGAIIFDTPDKVLMTLVLKRGMLRWELPAGVAKEGESLEETAQREVLEETGKHIKIGNVAALSWHYSRKLQKGWMGMIFYGRLVKDDSSNTFLVATPEAFVHTKFTIRDNPELYKSINLIDYDFEELRYICADSSHSTTHESVVAGGFIEWKKIPIGRIHPLHRKLLESYDSQKKNIGLLYSVVEEDISVYDDHSKLYYTN